MGGGPATETLLLIFEGNEPKHITDHIRAEFPYIDFIYHQQSREDVPESFWQQATILVTLSVLPPKPELVPKLRWIQLLSAGIDQIVNQPIYKDTDISLTTASGIHGPAISEWVLMTSLALAKNYNLMHDHQKQHKWDSRSVGLLKRRDWYGKTVGIAGYGSIGRQGQQASSSIDQVANWSQSLVYLMQQVPRSTRTLHRLTQHRIRVVILATLFLAQVIQTAPYLKSGTVEARKVIFISSLDRVSTFYL